MIPEDLKYTKDHEWIKIDNNEATIGITDFAQAELGDITFVEIPEKSTAINKSATLSTIESIKAASDIYAPMSGQISNTNERLESEPELLNNSPYTEGWICKIAISNESELSDLLNASDYNDFIQSLKK